ncbi:MAG: rRNA maturation RNase YbeY [Pyrinomonadaceae bacterium]
MTDVFNLQRKTKLELREYKSFVKDLGPRIPESDGRTFSVAFVSDTRMRQLNEMFRDIDSTTDVLSFPHEPDGFDEPPSYLGDIVISAEQAAKQAAENGLPLDGEIKQLILHGLLHLCGYDHDTDDGEMNAREIELRIQLKI